MIISFFFNPIFLIFKNEFLKENGGNIGWIDENNLTDKLVESLEKISIGQNTDVIQLGNNFIIIKIIS